MEVILGSWETDIMKQTITVCDHCLMASCWQGIFMCNESLEAGTVEKTVEELKELALESESFWDIDPDTMVARSWS